ncbi:MAG: flagellar biosynthetic protein FliR [Armatimonadota bacterium]
MSDLVAALLERFIPLLPAAMRVVGMAALAPGLSLQQAPAQVRGMLAVALAVAIAPVAACDAAVPDEPLRLIGLCLSELAVGLAMGFVAATVLEALRFGGEVLDLQMGLRAGQLFDPTSGAHAGILSTAYAIVALLLFVTIDGHHWLLRGLAASFTIVPVGAAGVGGALLTLVGDLGTALLTVGLRIAAPVMAALLLADLAFGIVARAVPQINVFLVGIPAKIAVGLIIAALGAPVLLANLGGLARLMARSLDLLIRALGD